MNTSTSSFVSWRPLNIDNLVTLSEDVERTIENYRKVLKEGRANEVSEAKEDIERKMAVLFAFKKQHHNGIPFSF